MSLYKEEIRQKEEKKKGDKLFSFGKSDRRGNLAR
jgi:hypothetical protein